MSNSSSIKDLMNKKDLNEEQYAKLVHVYAEEVRKQEKREKEMQ